MQARHEPCYSNYQCLTCVTGVLAAQTDTTESALQHATLAGAAHHTGCCTLVQCTMHCMYVWRPYTNPTKATADNVLLHKSCTHCAHRHPWQLTSPCTVSHGLCCSWSKTVWDTCHIDNLLPYYEGDNPVGHKHTLSPYCIQLVMWVHVLC